MNAPENDSVSASPASRLSLIHLLAWMPATALGIRVYQLMPPILGSNFGVLPEAYVCVMGFVLGTIALGGTVLFLSGQMKDAGPEPGHWMLILGIASAVSNGIAFAVVATHISPESSYTLKELYLAHLMMFVYGPHSFWLIHQTVAWGLGTIAAVFWFRRLRHQVMMPWKTVAALFVASAAVVFCGNLVALFRMKFTVSTGPLIASPLAVSWLFWWLRWWCRRSGHVFAALVVACTIAMLVAVMFDVGNRRRRDWLHWLGIGAWLVVATVQLITFSVFHLGP